MEAENLMKLSLHQRRNGIVSQTLDLLELISVNKSSDDPPPCYTSLKDILPSTTTTVDSPAVTFAASAEGPISIRNRLVKQAACAYLQPSTPTPSSNPSFLRRVSSASSPHSSIPSSASSHLLGESSELRMFSEER